MADGPTFEGSLLLEALRYGVVGLIAILFAKVIVYLYKENRADLKDGIKERKEWSDERIKWASEREKLGLDYERRHREVVEGYAHQLVQVREAAQKRDDSIRQEVATMMDKVSANSNDVNEALIEMLKKIHEKLVK